MMGGDQRTFDLVVRHVERWIPRDAYDDERDFRAELAAYLDTKLNEQPRSGTGSTLGWRGGQRELPVTTDRDRGPADVVVDGLVGIELRCDPGPGRTEALRDSIDDSRREYPYVVACACGLSDVDGWRRLEREYASGDAGDPQVVFVRKRAADFGKTPPDVARDDGGMFDGLL